MDRPEQTLSAVLDAGELLLTSGAEAARVEDTMRRLARAYGFCTSGCADHHGQHGSNGTDGRRSGDHADTPHPAARNRYALH